MFGRMKTKDIPSLKNYAEAVAYWNSIKPIRNRNEDLRPIGERRKQHMRIAKSQATGDVHCVLYTTSVVTFHSDDTITVSVPEHWRTNSTAQFIEAVLGSHNVNLGMRNGDVIMALNGHYFRMGVETRFKLLPEGLLLLEGNIVRSTHSVDRKVMNAARKETKGFTTYLRGANKLREGMYSVDELSVLYEFLRKHNQVASNVSAEMFATSSSYWSLSAVWAMKMTHSKESFSLKMTHSKESFSRWLDRVKFVLQTMRTGTHEEWYVLSVWLAASNYWVTSTFRVELAKIENNITCMLLAVTPDALVETPEPFGVVKVDAYAGEAMVRRAVLDMKEKNT